MRDRGAAFGMLLLLPTIVLLALFLVIPLAALLVTSLHAYSSAQGVSATWTLENYRRILVDPFYLGVIRRTVVDAAITTVLCAIVGYPLALYLTSVRGAGRAYLTLLLLAPLLVSMVIRSYGWVIILGSHGPLASLLAAIHVPAPSLLYTDTAVVIGLVHVSLAYMVLPIVGSLERIDPAVARAAQNLGANGATVFRRVTLPLTLPGLSAGSVIVFSLSVSAFVTPSILGGSRVKLLSTFVYDQIVSLLNWPLGSALGFVLMIVATGMLVIFSGLLSRANAGVRIA